MTRGKGVIHDLGYARYAGERRPPSTVWRVIMRQHLSHAWKTRWRYKPWLALAVIITVIAGGFVYLQTLEPMRAVREAGGSIPVIDRALPRSFDFYRLAAFMATMTVGAAAIARDEESGAFTFYFSRPVRPIDYVLGKLAGQIILLATIFLAGPLLLALYRINVSLTNAERLDQLSLIPAVLAVGSLATVFFSAVPLAISAIAGRRTIALGLWAAYYILGAKFMVLIGAYTWHPLMAVDPGQSMSTVALAVFGFEELGDGVAPPLWAAIGSMVLQSAIAVWVLVTQVRRHAIGSVGGSS